MTIKMQLIKNRLVEIEKATRPGANADGAEIRVTIGFVKHRPTAQALKEAAPARRHGLDLKTFTGILDRVFFTAAGELCMTMLTAQRVRVDGAGDAHFCHRTFNVDAGQVRALRVLSRPARALRPQDVAKLRRLGALYGKKT